MITADAVLPAQWAREGCGVLSCCSRHGDVAVERRSIKFVSVPPRWLRLILGQFGAIGASLALIGRKSVLATDWPLCARCARKCRVVRPVALAAMATGAVLFTLPAVLDPRGGSGIEFATMGLGFVLFFAGWFAATFASPRLVGGAVVVSEGTQLSVGRPHPRFAAEVAAAQGYRTAPVAWQSTPPLVPGYPPPYPPPGAPAAYIAPPPPGYYGPPFPPPAVPAGYGPPAPGYGPPFPPPVAVPGHLHPFPPPGVAWPTAQAPLPGYGPPPFPVGPGYGPPAAAPGVSAQSPDRRSPSAVSDSGSGTAAADEL